MQTIINLIYKSYNFINDKFSPISCKFLKVKSYNYKKLYIFSLHSTRVEHFKKYKYILKKIDDIAPFINPNNLNEFIDTNAINTNRSILTLDDGFKDNYSFAQTILKDLNIKAIFFVIPYFLFNNYQKEDFLKALYPKQEIDFTKISISDFQHLTIDQVYSLNEAGHIIGAHGFKHESATSLTLECLNKITSQAKDDLSQICQSLDHFCYPFGSKEYFNNYTNIILKNNFKFIHTGIRGSNSYKEWKSRIFKRHTISTHGKDLKYYPYSYEKIYFIVFNELSRFPISLYKMIKKIYEFYLIVSKSISNIRF